jgi:limonene 1,2-monooxygenase
VAAIRNLYETVGGFGVVLGFAHDWANREATARSWDLFARYVIPEVNGYLRGLRGSAEYLAANKGDLIAGATAAVLDQIMANPRAAEALDVTIRQAAGQDGHE